MDWRRWDWMTFLVIGLALDVGLAFGCKENLDGVQ